MHGRGDCVSRRLCEASKEARPNFVRKDVYECTSSVHALKPRNVLGWGSPGNTSTYMLSLCVCCVRGVCCVRV